MDDDMMVNHEVATDCAEFDKEERRSGGDKVHYYDEKFK